MRALLVLLAFVSGACVAADYFGAIAYSPSSGADGWARDHPSRKAAERAAVAACKEYADDCRSVVWFKNGCGAVAANAKVYGYGWGNTQALADDQAVKHCGKHAQGCKVKRRVCTAGAR